MTAEPPDISIVVPFRNLRGQIAKRCAEIFTALGEQRFELLAIDDGSIDGGIDELRELATHDPRLRLVRLRRSFGQTAALAAGFDRARGAVIVTIDADGQTNPADIAPLLAAIESGADIVSGWRDIPRSLPTQIGNALIVATTGVLLHDYGCPLKAYRAEVLHEMHLYGDLYRFAPAMATWHGAQVAEVLVREQPRSVAKPGSGLRRVIGILLDLLTVRFLLGYQARPLQAIGRVAGLMGLLAVLLGVYLGYLKLFLGEDIGARPLTALAVLTIMLAGQLLVAGLLAELATRVYFESQHKPIYVVREEIG
ncbi:MAG: glycosyltransferase [Roseiflexaceae bacterium]|nr:glycosyltransferase [Roseiflexaceae bacterium]